MSKMYICKLVFFISFTVIVCFISGCSSKKHFEPKVISGDMRFDGKLSAPLRDVSRVGALLNDNTLISFSQGVTSLVLEKDYKFLAQDKNTYVVQKQCKDVLIIDGENNVLQQLPFDTCILSADIKNNKLAIVLIDNTIVFYDIAQKKEVFSQKYSSVLAINSYLASPQITNKYVIFPNLEGKILILDIEQNKIVKDILVSSDKFFNNVIYMHIQGTYMLAATAKRISAIIDNKSFKYDVDLRDVVFFNNKIYVLSIEGEVLELDHTLKLLRKVRLPFAVLSGIVIANNTLYTLEKGGYLIEINLTDFTPLVYKNHLSKKKSFFYTNDTLFYDSVYKRFK